MHQIQHKVIGTLEDIKERLEQNDEKLLKRERVFAKQAIGAPDAANLKKGDEMIEIHKSESEELQQFKAVSYELLDIGLFYGKQCSDMVRSDPIYQKMDQYVKFDDKFEVAISYGEKIYIMLLPYATYLLSICQIYITVLMSYINVIESRLHPYIEKVLRLYAKITKLAQELWKRLDYDEDGTVSFQDARDSSTSLFEYIKTMDYTEASRDVKNRLYTDAIAYMEHELEQAEKLSKESKDKMVEAIPENQEQKFQKGIQVN